MEGGGGGGGEGLCARSDCVALDNLFGWKPRLTLFALPLSEGGGGTSWTDCEQSVVFGERRGAIQEKINATAAAKAAFTRLAQVSRILILLSAAAAAAALLPEQLRHKANKQPTITISIPTCDLRLEAVARLVQR